MLAAAASMKGVAMRLVRTVVLSAVLAVYLLALAAPAGAQSSPTLVDVRAGRHPGFDRVVFEFRGGLPSHRVRHVDRLVQDGSGNQVQVAGAADLEVVFQDAVAHDGNGQPTVGPRRFSPRFPVLEEVALVGDFEGVVSYGLGLDHRVPFKTSTLSNPSRLVVDLPTSGSGSSSVSGGGSGGTLPFTGSRSQSLLVTGLGLLATGATVLALARRTRTP
jgi:hypothetical protein